MDRSGWGGEALACFNSFERQSNAPRVRQWSWAKNGSRSRDYLGARLAIMAFVGYTDSIHLNVY
jgi:hypothetical protein